MHACFKCHTPLVEGTKEKNGRHIFTMLWCSRCMRTRGVRGERAPIY